MVENILGECWLLVTKEKKNGSGTKRHLFYLFTFLLHSAELGKNEGLLKQFFLEFSSKGQCTIFEKL